jgi:hypothetical protein
VLGAPWAALFYYSYFITLKALKAHFYAAYAMSGGIFSLLLMGLKRGSSHGYAATKFAFKPGGFCDGHKAHRKIPRVRSLRRLKQSS